MPTPPLRLLAAGGPILFTAAWLWLGALTPDYSQRPDTISQIGELGQPYAVPMTVAFVVQGAGQLAGAALAWRRPPARSVALSLVVAGLGTLGVGVFPLPGADGATWLAPAHAVAATAAFTGLHLAALAAVFTSSVPRWLRIAAGVTLVVAVPNLAWFLTHLTSGGSWYGGSEKTFVTVLLLWCAALACCRVRRRTRTSARGRVA